MRLPCDLRRASSTSTTATTSQSDELSYLSPPMLAAWTVYRYDSFDTLSRELKEAGMSCFDLLAWASKYAFTALDVRDEADLRESLLREHLIQCKRVRECVCSSWCGSVAGWGVNRLLYFGMVPSAAECTHSHKHVHTSLTQCSLATFSVVSDVFSRSATSQ